MLLRCFEGCVLGSLVFFIGSGRSVAPSFFIDSGRNVWHWRSPQHRSKNGVIELARPCCFPVPEAAFLGRLLGQKSWFCRLWYPNATEGANGVFRRQLEVQIAPQSCKTFFFFIDSGRNVWHWRSPQHRSKNGVIELARPCCFPVPEAAFLGRLLGQKSWFCRSWYPNATEGANGVFRRQLEVQIAPQSCKTSFFYRFWMRRLTLKITQRRSKNGVLEFARPCCFPVPEAAFLGRLLGQKSWFCRSWYPNATEGANGASPSQIEVRNEHRSKNELLEFARPCCCAVLKAAFWEALSFLSVPAAAFDIEDHPSTGRKTVSLSSPDHAVSLFRRQPFCVIELARPCCFPVPEAAFLGRLLGQKSWFCRSWYPNATEGANGASPSQIVVRTEPQSCKTFFF